MIDAAAIRAADQQHAWHPFTAMRDWCAPEHEPLVLVSGEGAVLRDSEGREYLDGNSSIWTNLHGHRHPRIDAAIRAQLDRVAHTSFLGFTNPPAAQLASELAALFPPETLSRVFFSDDGSTAIEVAVKMALQFWRQTGEPQREVFVSFRGAYHGDTLGAASLGGIGTFQGDFANRGLRVANVDSLAELANIDSAQVAGVIIEPLIQGAAGMRLWPRGLLAELRAWCDTRGTLLILDEVMTGFGRTGRMFACEHEAVIPDFLAVAKGLTGGYMPLAATLTSERIFRGFLGEGGTFFYGHSYTGNQLGCAAALANLAIFREEETLAMIQEKARVLARLLEPLHAHPQVLEVRQCGLIAGIELRPSHATGAQVCIAARAHGLLTRPIGNVLVLMPPYCISEAQLAAAVRALTLAIDEVCAVPRGR